MGRGMHTLRTGIAPAVTLWAALWAAQPGLAQSGSRWDGVTGTWTVTTPDGRWLGEIWLEAGITLSGDGSLGPDGGEVFLSPGLYGDDAVELFVHHGIGDQSPGRLLLSEDGFGDLHGTYVRADRWQQVRLTRVGADPGFDPQDEDFADLPGIGVAGPPYRLRNVAADGWVRVHRWPRVVSGQFDQRLWRDSTDILVLDCDPPTDAAVIETADAATRLRIMDGLWCRIDHVDAGGMVTEGWVEGRHLEPMWERIGGRP